MNKGLIKLHDKLLAGEADIKDVSDKDLKSMRKNHISDPVKMLSYPTSDVFFMVLDELRRREIEAAKKPKPTQEDINKMFMAMKNKKKSYRKDFY